MLIIRLKEKEKINQTKKKKKIMMVNMIQNTMTRKMITMRKEKRNLKKNTMNTQKKKMKRKKTKSLLKLRQN